LANTVNMIIQFVTV